MPRGVYVRTEKHKRNLERARAKAQQVKARGSFKPLNDDPDDATVVLDAQGRSIDWSQMPLEYIFDAISVLERHVFEARSHIEQRLNRMGLKWDDAPKPTKVPDPTSTTTTVTKTTETVVA